MTSIAWGKPLAADEANDLYSTAPWKWKWTHAEIVTWLNQVIAAELPLQTREPEPLDATIAKILLEAG